MRYLIALLCASFAATAVAGDRRTIVVSDSHFGVGRNGASWDPREDFRWSVEWTAFLSHLQSAKRSTDLVLNGDTFEMWQSMQDDCRYHDLNLGCTESEAENRIQRVLNEHKAELVALREFANYGANRVYIVPGNHDSALLFAGVTQRVLHAIGAKQGRVRVQMKGYWQSADGRIVAVHGHQMDDVNRFRGWPKPFITRRGVRYLRRPWGQQFVQQYYNDFEEKYEIIDNIITEADAIRFGAASEGLRTVLDLRAFAFFMADETSISQLGTYSAGPKGDETSEKGSWDLEAVRGPQMLIDLFATDDPAREEISKAADAGMFAGVASKLTDSDLQKLCDRRAVLHAQDEHFVPCPSKSLALGVITLAIGDAKHFKAYLTKLDDFMQHETKRAFDVVVLSHTHSAEAPVNIVLEGRRVVSVTNSGAWQRVIHAKDIEVYRRSHAMRM
ncbi:MAG TPA: metallophosphoesterase, partial [Thermoanaerobaculia bacterium]